MGKPNKECFECGKPYEICYICDTETRFSWREVCCSIECYTKYLEKINGDLDEVKQDVVKSRTKSKEEIISDVIEEVVDKQ